MDQFKHIKEAVSLTGYAEDHLQRVHGGFVCPACGSGTGKNHTPAFSIYGPEREKWKCFKCQSGGDVFDLAGIVKGLEGKAEQARSVAEWAGIALSLQAVKERKDTPERTEAEQETIERHRANEAARIKAAQKMLKDKPQECAEAIEYLEARGFSYENSVALGFGYEQRSKSIVIPWEGSSYYHIDRVINPGEGGHKYNKPSAKKVGSQPLYNPEAFSGEIVFIVEGALDAAAISLTGNKAIAMGTANAKQICKAAEEARYRGIVVGMFDNDDTGTYADVKAREMFNKAGIAYISGIIPDSLEAKDAAELLENGGVKKLGLFLDYCKDQAAESLEHHKEREYEEAMSAFHVRNPEAIVEKLYFLEAGGTEAIPTGIQALDNALNGGMRKGLCILGACSSLGKTTLAVQVADRIAASGRGVLFVTIEQSTEEIVAKSLSRLMSAKGKEVSTSEVMDASRRDYWDLLKREAFADVCEEYTRDIAPNMRILEAYSQPSVENIRNAAEAMRKYAGTAPVVFVDYLQLIAAQNEHDTDKRTVDKNVMSLKQMARDLETPVFAISSLNRSSYGESISLESFKESGAIEYGADVLLGLQFRGLDSKPAEDRRARMKELKRQNVRPCELVVLKNRNGALCEPIPLTFKCIASTLKEGEEEEAKPKRRVI